MIDKELLSILACPKTHQTLSEATTDQIEQINDVIRGGRQKNVDGSDVTDEIEGGLVREDGQILYPIRSGIPVLLIDEGLPLEAGSA